MNRRRGKRCTQAEGWNANPSVRGPAGGHVWIRNNRNGSVTVCAWWPGCGRPVPLPRAGHGGGRVIDQVTEGRLREEGERILVLLEIVDESDGGCVHYPDDRACTACYVDAMMPILRRIHSKEST